MAGRVAYALRGFISSGGARPQATLLHTSNPIVNIDVELPTDLPTLNEITEQCTLNEITEQCVRIHSNDPAFTRYVCSAASFQYDDFDACEINRELSSHYGSEVVVCRVRVR